MGDDKKKGFALVLGGGDDEEEMPSSQRGESYSEDDDAELGDALELFSDAMKKGDREGMIDAFRAAKQACKD